MKTEERRKERMPETIVDLKSRYADVVDLTPFEAMGLSMECKGALVTDWANLKIYCSLSKRANEEVFTYMIAKLNQIARK